MIKDNNNDEGFDGEEFMKEYLNTFKKSIDEFIKKPEKIHKIMEDLMGSKALVAENEEENGNNTSGERDKEDSFYDLREEMEKLKIELKKIKRKVKEILHHLNLDVKHKS